MSPTYLFNRDTGVGWPEPIHEQPTRGPKAHKPTECAEVYGNGLAPYRRLFQCPICKAGYERTEDELPKGFIGLSCFGDAVLEGVEP